MGSSLINSKNFNTVTMNSKSNIFFKSHILFEAAVCRVYTLRAQLCGVRRLLLCTVVQCIHSQNAAKIPPSPQRHTSRPSASLPCRNTVMTGSCSMCYLLIGFPPSLRNTLCVMIEAASAQVWPYIPAMYRDITTGHHVLSHFRIATSHPCPRAVHLPLSALMLRPER